MVSESERCIIGVTGLRHRTGARERPRPRPPGPADARTRGRARRGRLRETSTLGEGFNTSQRYMHRYDSYPIGCFNITVWCQPFGCQEWCARF